MRILVTTIVDLRRTSHNRLHEYIRYLIPNHDITVLSLYDRWQGKQADVQSYNQDFEEMLRPIHIRYFTERRCSPIVQELFSFVTLSKLLREIDYKSFDVHLNYNTLVSGYFVAKKLKSAGINTVYDIAEPLPERIRISPQIIPPLRPLGGVLGDIMLKKNVDIARKITVIIESMKESLGIPAFKSEIIPNGVDFDLFRNKPHAQLREELGLGKSFVLGFVGVLREWLDFGPVFAAVKELSDDNYDIKMLVVGGEGRPRENRALAINYKISDRVVFTGSIPYIDVPKYVSCMDACLTPFTLGNSQALCLLEYLACGKPVISTNSLEIPSNLVLYATNKEEYKRQIIRLLTNRELRKEMGLRSRKYVEENHSWLKSAQMMESVLQSVAINKA